MTHRVGGLHCRYRCGPGADAGRVTSDLNHLAVARLPEVLADALDAVCAGDPSVYVIRHVTAGTTLHVGAGRSEGDVVRRWAADLAAAVARAIRAGGPEDGSGRQRGGPGDGGPELVRFADTAEHIACFLADALAGSAWDRWYHGRFAHLRQLPFDEVVRAVLLGDGVDPTAVLVRLRGAGHLQGLLATLRPETLGLVRSSLAGGGPVPDVEMFRWPMSVAVQIAAELEDEPGPVPDETQLLEDYLDTAPAPVDWRDHRGLALAIAHAVAFLVRAGHLRRTAPSREPAVGRALDASLARIPWLDGASRAELCGLILQVIGAAGGAGRTDISGGERAVDRGAPSGDGPGAGGDARARHDSVAGSDARSRHRFVVGSDARSRHRSVAGGDAHPAAASVAGRDAGSDEVSAVSGHDGHGGEPEADTDAGRGGEGEGVGDLSEVGRGPTPQPVQATPVPGPWQQTIDRMAQDAATARQRRLLDDLVAALRNTSLALDPAVPAGPANAIRLHIALVAQNPSWAGDAMAAVVIDRLLQAWAASTVNKQRARWVGTAEPDATSGTAGVGSAQPDSAGPRLGERGRTALRALIDQSVPASSDSTTARTGSGGLALLLPALLDTDLYGILERLEGPDPSAVLAALGLRLAHVDAGGEPQPDQGLAWLAGRDDVPSLGDLRGSLAALDAPAGERLQHALVSRLAGLRVLTPSPTLHVHLLPRNGTEPPLLVAGDGSARLWPLAAPLTGAGGEAPTVLAWLRLLGETTGYEPDQVCCDDPLQPRLAGRLGAMTVLAPEEGGVSDDVAEAHAESRVSLLRSWAALEPGRLGLSDADVSLTVTVLSLMRTWARWLRQFADSSPSFLLEQFLRRSAFLTLHERSIAVALEPRPLDLVLDMVGYARPVGDVPWLGGRGVVFTKEHP